MRNEHTDDEGLDGEKARNLIESGDMGYRGRYGKEYLQVENSSDHGKVLNAATGSTKQEFEAGLRYAESQRSQFQALGYTVKKYSIKKQSKYREQKKRMCEITEVTFDDPHVLPRDIKAEEFVNLYSAVACLNSRGYMFNVHLTISWELLGYGKRNSLNHESPLNAKFIRHYTEWCLSKKIDCVWIYSNEFSKKIGYHTHFMTSVEPVFLKEFIEYIDKRMRKISKKNKLSEFRPNAYRIEVNKKETVYKQWATFRYLCKGIDQNAKLSHANNRDSVYVRDLIDQAYENPGNLCYKRRCGLSENIRRPQREKIGFYSLMEKGVLNVDLLYSDQTFNFLAASSHKDIPIEEQFLMLQI